MGNARELLARLNPTTIRYNIGVGGGEPGLSNIDIAGALGFVPAGLGREVLECCYMTDRVRLTARLGDLVVPLIRAEWRRQIDAFNDAKVELGIAHVCVGWTGRTTQDQRQNLARAQAAYLQAKAALWPDTSEVRMQDIALAVLQEIAGSSICDACGGGSMEVCTRCAGTGRVGWSSERGRAEAIGVSQTTYRGVGWGRVYGWMLDLLRDAETCAAGQLAAAMRDPQVAA